MGLVGLVGRMEFPLEMEMELNEYDVIRCDVRRGVYGGIFISCGFVRPVNSGTKRQRGGRRVMDVIWLGNPES